MQIRSRSLKQKNRESLMMKRVFPIVFLILCVYAWSAIHPSEMERKNNYATQTQQLGTDEKPITVKIQPSRHAEEDAAKEERYKEEKSKEDRTLSDETAYLASVLSH
jgi:hypothetical protein